MDSLTRFIKHINLIPYSILAAILFVGHRIGFSIWKSNTSLFTFQKYGPLIFYASAIFLFGMWLYFFGLNLVCVRYTRLTGRKSYVQDKAEFSKSYIWLVDFYTHANPYKMDEKTLPIQNWRDAEGIIFGKTKDGRLIKRDTDAPGHCCLFAGSGKGKTVSQIIPSALRFGGSVLAIDIKGDILKWTKGKRKIKIFDPERPDTSCCFDPFFGIKAMSEIEIRMLIEDLSNIIIPDEGGNGNNYFTQGGRDYFCGIAHLLLHENIETSFMDVVYAILTGNAFKWVLDAEQSDCTVAQTFLLSYKGSNEKNVAGCYNALVKKIRPFTNGNLPKLLSNDGDVITPKTLEDGFDIYLEIPQDKINVYAPVTTIIVQTFMNAFMRREDDSSGKSLRKYLILLDEFCSLHFDFETFLTCVSLLRSKGITCFCAMQSISQLELRYGDAPSRAIMDNMAYISVMNAKDPKSQEYFQKLIGREKRLKVSTSTSAQDQHKGDTVSEVMEYIYEAADFAFIGEKGDDVIICNDGRYIQCQKTKCYE